MWKEIHLFSSIFPSVNEETLRTKLVMMLQIFGFLKLTSENLFSFLISIYFDRPPQRDHRSMKPSKAFHFIKKKTQK